MIYYLECVKNEPTNPMKMDCRLFIEDTETGDKKGFQLVIDLPDDESPEGIEAAVDAAMAKTGMTPQHGEWEDLR